MIAGPGPILILAVILTTAPAVAQDNAPGTTPPAAPAPSATAPGATAPGTPPQAAPAPAWIARGNAQLTVLDKVSATPAPVTVPVGGQATYGPLTISVRACDIRPPDRAPDATAFLDVTDSTPGATEFHGWLIRSAPGASMFENPGYDIRLKGCA